jgi:tetratricopeptide (TPR) repeat protein
MQANQPFLKQHSSTTSVPPTKHSEILTRLSQPTAKHSPPKQSSTPATHSPPPTRTTTWATHSFANKKYAEAIDAFTQAVAIRAKSLRPTHPLVLASRVSPSLALVHAVKPEQAIEQLELAAKNYETAFGPKHPGNAAAWTSLGQAYCDLARYDDAIAAFEKTLSWQKPILPADAPQLIATRANVAIAKLKRGDAGAEQSLRATLEELKQAKGNFATIIRMSEEALKK